MKLDKGRIEVGNLHERKSDRAYWLSKTPEERFAAMEYLRRMNFGYDEDSPRLQRLLEVVERKRG